MPAHESLTATAHNTRLVGFHDLQGRESLQVTLQRDWCYVGHLPGYLPNPLTGQKEHSGTSILDVSNPAKPNLVAHIPSEPEANCRAVQVINGRDGKRYLARNHETAAKCSFQVFDITDRAQPKFVSEVAETPQGKMNMAHKGWWDETSGLYFGTACESDFRPGGHLAVWDLSTPSKPNYVSSHWFPGQLRSEPEPTKAAKGYNLHHPVVDIADNRVYLSYARGGNVAVLDIKNRVFGKSCGSISRINRAFPE